LSSEVVIPKAIIKASEERVNEKKYNKSAFVNLRPLLGNFN